MANGSLSERRAQPSPPAAGQGPVASNELSPAMPRLRPPRIRRRMAFMTRIAVEVPEDIAKRLESAWRDVSRGTLEALALEGYRDGTLSREQVGRVLGLSFGETEAFLKARQAYLAYDEEDLKSDLRDLRQLGSR